MPSRRRYGSRKKAGRPRSRPSLRRRTFKRKRYRSAVRFRRRLRRALAPRVGRARSYWSQFPERLQVKLRYNYNGHDSFAANANDLWAFSGNSIFDPYSGTGGNTAAFLKTYADRYSRYRVRWSRIYIEVTPCSVDSATVLGSSAILPRFVRCELAPSSTSGDPFPATTVRINLNNLAFAKRREAVSYAPSQPSVIRMKHAMSTRRLYGFSRSQESYNDDFCAAFTASPVNQWYWVFRLDNPYSPTSVVYAYRVWITYGVEMFTRYQQQPDYLGTGE